MSAKELMLLNLVLEKTLESPLDSKEIKPVTTRKYLPMRVLTEGRGEGDDRG